MKLTSKQAAGIKRALAEGKTQPEIAKKWKISRSTVSDIATGRIHKDVPWPEGQPIPKRPGGQRRPTGDHDPTNARILELEAEVVHLTEERNRERAKSKASAKFQGLFRAMSEVLTAKIVAVKPLPPAWKPSPAKGRTIEEHVVMHLSDGHHDQIVRPEECGHLEYYNFDVSCCRAERYVNTLLQWTQDTLAPRFRFPVLSVLCYGDFTSGEIHGHVERSYFRNQFRNCLAIGKLHALMYRDLAPHFEKVNVVYVPGNHGRRSSKKDHHGAWNNWDYLIAEIARLYCADIANVDFLIPDAWSVNLDIDGVGFNISHGDDVKGALGIPYYGLQRRQRSLTALGHVQAGPRIRYFCCGHFHKPGLVGDMDGEILVNGTWVATDAFAFNTYAGYTEPMQWIHGVNRKYGITWRLGVLLRSEEEKQGPKRYRIKLDEASEE